VLPTSPKVISDNDDLEHNLLIGNIKTVPDKTMVTKAKTGTKWAKDTDTEMGEVLAAAAPHVLTQAKVPPPGKSAAGAGTKAKRYLGHKVGLVDAKSCAELTIAKKRPAGRVCEKSVQAWAEAGAPAGCMAVSLRKRNTPPSQDRAPKKKKNALRAERKPARTPKTGFMPQQRGTTGQRSTASGKLTLFRLAARKTLPGVKQKAMESQAVAGTQGTDDRVQAQATKASVPACGAAEGVEGQGANGEQMLGEPAALRRH
jgi:hypothetical protein